MVRAYADELGKDFYDENTVNPIFNKIEYEKNKYDMNNQPYLLKSPKDVIAIAQKRASASSNDGNLSLNVLKDISYVYKISLDSAKEVYKKLGLGSSKNANNLEKIELQMWERTVNL